MRCWIAVACQEHVQKAVEGGFAQVCHGKSAPLKRMNEGDGMIYYSPTIHFGIKDSCQSFTAIGKVTSDDPYPFAMSENFIPWRRNVNFFPSKDAPIQVLLEDLSFIKDKRRWGFPFRRGFFEISQTDFELIANTMGIF